MAQIAQVAEVQAAQAFLKQLGAPWKNTDLIYAVIAWMRQESGSLKNVIGNNPFNLRPGKDIPSDLVYGVRKTKNGNGYFLVFKTLEDGLKAAAIRLLKAGNDWRGYDLIVKAFRNGNAIDALNAIALSAWNVSHYGYKNGDTTTNHLYQVYIQFTGLQMPKPKPPAKKKPPIPQRPRDVNPPIIVRNYLDARHARSLLEDPRRRVKPLPD